MEGKKATKTDRISNMIVRTAEMHFKLKIFHHAIVCNFGELDNKTLW